MSVSSDEGAVHSKGELSESVDLDLTNGGLKRRELGDGVCVADDDDFLSRLSDTLISSPGSVELYMIGVAQYRLDTEVSPIPPLDILEGREARGLLSPRNHYADGVTTEAHRSGCLL
jgi:hypothetical protein